MALLTRTPYIDPSHLEMIRQLVQGKKPPMLDIPGYAGGTLGDQLDRSTVPDASPDRMSGVASSPVLERPQPVAPPPIQPTLMPENTSPGIAPPDLSATDYYQTNPAIRPKVDPAILDRTAQQQDYERNLTNYQPQRESKKQVLVRTLLGFLQHGIPGAVMTAGSELLDRRQHDRAWQQNELGRTDEVLNQLTNRRREGMQERVMQSQIDRNEQDKATPATVKYGDYNIAPDLAARLAQEAKLAANKPKAERGVLQREVKHADGGSHWEQSYDNGRTWEKSTGSGNDAPLQKPEEDVSAENARVQANIRELEGAIKQMGDPPPTQLPGVVYSDNTQGPPQANPAYAEWQSRMDKYSGELRTERLKLKSPKLTRGQARSMRQYSGKPWSLAQWRAKNPGASPEQEDAAKTKATNAQMRVIQ